MPNWHGQKMMAPSLKPVILARRLASRAQAFPAVVQDEMEYAIYISEQPTLELAFSRRDNLRSADRPIYDRPCPAPPRSFPGT